MESANPECFAHGGERDVRVEHAGQEALDVYASWRKLESGSWRRCEAQKSVARATDAKAESLRDMRLLSC